jgi:chaperonin GroEL
MKKILFGKEAKEKIQEGVNLINDSVKYTLGSKGRNVLLDRGIASYITNDGITISRDVMAQDEIAQLAVKTIREASAKTNEEAGDGTTTSILLASEIFNRSLSYDKPVDIAKQIIEAKNKIVKNLKELAIPVQDDDLIKVATVSSKDDKIGKIVADTIKEIGKDGIITVENNNRVGIETETVNGLQIDKGYISPYFITDPQKLKAELNDSLILLTNHKIVNLKLITPLLQNMIQNGSQTIFIMADDVDGAALQDLIVNNMKGMIKCVVVKMPKFKKGVYEDVSIITGAKVIDKEAGMKLEDIKLEDLGFAKKVESFKNRTLIVDGDGDKNEVQKYISILNLSVDNIKDELEKDETKKRVAKLLGGVAVIKVGAQTEVEQNSLKDRIDDAIRATQSALEEGIVGGGGVALLKCMINNPTNQGEVIMNFTLQKPTKQILENCGVETGITLQDGWVGYNANTDKVEDLLESGIIDPVKVIRVALENAVSVATLLLTTEVVIANELDKKE